jgi:hypothetical protein
MSKSPPIKNLRSDSQALPRWFTGVRRRGLLARLTPEAWHTLSAVLSFTTGEGRATFTLDQLCVALGQPRPLAAEHLQGLSVITETGEPLVLPERDQAGEISGATIAPLAELTFTAPEFTPAPLPSDDPLSGALAAAGLNASQIQQLLRAFPNEQITRQLTWLPARGARNPAALLIRAIEGDWDPPKEVT